VNGKKESLKLKYITNMKGEDMKVLGVSGSPIRNSNTDRALRTVLEAKVRKWSL
jgi:hypothetical protein